MHRRTEGTSYPLTSLLLTNPSWTPTRRGAGLQSGGSPKLRLSVDTRVTDRPPVRAVRLKHLTDLLIKMDLHQCRSQYPSAAYGPSKKGSAFYLKHRLSDDPRRWPEFGYESGGEEVRPFGHGPEDPVQFSQVGTFADSGEEGCGNNCLPMRLKVLHSRESVQFVVVTDAVRAARHRCTTKDFGVARRLARFTSMAEGVVRSGLCARKS